MTDIGTAALQGQGKQEAAREVAVMLQGNTSDYQEQMQQAGDATLSVVEALEKVEKAFVKTFRVVGKNATLMGAGLTGLTASSTAMAASFEDGFARVAKTTGLIGNDLRNLGEEIRDISTDIPVDVGQLSQLADLAGQLGISAKNVDIYAKVGAQLGAATNIGAGQAVSALANLRTNFNLAEEDVEGLGSAFAELTNKTRATEPEILGFSERVGGTAAALGLAADEVMGWGAAITASGTQVELGATAFTQTMLTIERAVSTGSDEARKFATVMGMTRDELKEEWESDPSNVMVKFVESLTKEGESASVVMERLNMTGVGQTQTFLNLAAAGGELTDALNKSKTAMAGGNEALQDLADVRFGTVIQQLKVLRQSISEVIRSMGMPFLGVVQQLVKGMSWLVNLFNRLPQDAKSVIAVLGSIAGALLTIFGTISLLIASFHGFFFAVAMGSKAFGWIKAMALPGILALKKQVLALAASIDAANISTFKLVPALTRTTAAAGGLSAALKGLIASLFGLGRAGAIKTFTFAFGEFGSAMMVLTRAAIPAFIAGIKALSVALFKIAAPLLALYGLFKGGQWLWNELKQDVAESDEVLSDLAKSVGATYTSFKALEGATDDVAKSAKQFTEANRELLDTLNSLSSVDAEDFLQVASINLLMGGTPPEEVREIMDELADRVRSLDGQNVRLRFPTDEAAQFSALMREIKDGADAIEQAANTGSGWAKIISRPADEAVATVRQQMEAVGHLSEEEGGFAAAIAAAFQVREGIELIDNNAVRSNLLEEWEVLLEGVFQDMGEVTRGKIGKLFSGVTEATTFEDFIKGFFGDAGADYGGQVVDPIRKSLEELGHDLNNLDQVDMDQLLVDFEKIAPALLEAQVAAGDLATELGVLEEKMLGAPEGDSERRHFREEMIKSHVAAVGHRQAIEDLNEELTRLSDANQAWGDEAKQTRQEIERLTQEYSSMQLQEIESMIRAGDAEQAVIRLRAQLRALDMDMPGAATIRSGLVQGIEQATNSIASQLSGLINQRDQMADQIASIESSTGERIADMRESHNERMADMEESHNERVADIHRRRKESLENASEQYQDRLKKISEDEKAALERMADEMARSYDPMRRIQSQPTSSGAGLAANIAQQNKVLNEFKSNLQGLKQAGLGEDVIKAMGLDDPKNFAQVGRMLQDVMADPGLISQINQQWSQRMDITSDFAEENKEDITKQYDEMRSEAAKAFAEQTKQINEEHAKSLAEQGKNFAKQQAKAREDLAKNIAKTTQDAAKQTDEISREMGELGKKTGDTLEELIQKGFDSNIEGIQNMAKALQMAIDATVMNIDEQIGYMEMRMLLATTKAEEMYPDYGLDPRRQHESAQPPPRPRETLGGRGGHAFHAGGIATEAMIGMLAEGGTSEAVIPLDGRGADVIGQAIGPYLAREISGMQYATPMNDNSTMERLIGLLERQGVSESINIGEVRAHDYHDFRRQLDDERRRKRLAGMTGGRDG